MKNIISIAVFASLSTLTSVSAIEQCDAWFQKNDFGIVGTMGKSGAGVVLDQNGEMSKIFASGTAHYDFNEGEEIDETLIEANMIAKSNLAKFLQEDIASEDSIEKISSKKKDLTTDGKNTNINVVKKSVKTQTMTLKNSAKALLTGVIKVCESNDAGKKEIQVVLAVSPKTAAAASKAANMFNKEIGSRKSVEEYAAERQNKSSGNSATHPSETNGQSNSGSFSNKAKNMNF
jgi:hypothetical protein